MTTLQGVVLDSLTTVIPHVPLNYFTDIPSYAHRTDKKRHIHTQAHDDVLLISHQVG